MADGRDGRDGQCLVFGCFFFLLEEESRPVFFFEGREI